MGVMSAKCKGSKEKTSPGIAAGNSRASNARKSVLHENEGPNSGQECSPGRNWATQRLDETDLFSPAKDDAEQITVTDILACISKQHTGMIHGIKKGAIDTKCGVSIEKKRGYRVH
jgi:hypothetical protein